MSKIEEIKALKEEKDVVILAHYYVEGDVQEIADFVGDSYALAKKATEVKQQNILFCGVRFMGESAKLLNPDKHVYMADLEADCFMARMVTAEQVKKVKAEHPDAAVVCYVNSTAEVKALSDVCVTSSNAIRVVKKMKEKEILFIPDNHLAHFVAKSVPEKTFIFHNGFCPVHQNITVNHIKGMKAEHPGALVLAHPECPQEILDEADFIGSTSEIIDFAGKSGEKEFVIATEMGVFHQLLKENPNKKFYPAMEGQVCTNMKKVTIDKVHEVLSDLKDQEELILPDAMMEEAKCPLEKMLELAK
ncbi:MAG: quinolinate synthase NadA [Roseburia sp.]|nr:quinolinate synthase NadA [Roseburia sp.]